MARYIDAEQFRGKHEVVEINGKLCSVIPYADIVYAPTADVAPKSEVARLEAELDDLKRDTIPKLQWGLQRANAMGRDLEVELEAMRTAANSYKIHYESLAKKICCEIEEEIVAALESNYRALKEWDDGRCNDYILEMVNRIKGKIDALRGIENFVEELKKKYTGEQT